MDRTQRLVDLLAYLVDAREPVSFEQIAGWFPAYHDAKSHDAAIRKFERDKADLVELGIPIRWIDPDDESDGGYVVDRDRLYLPPIHLGPDEMAVLFLAASAALSQDEFPYRHDLNLALQKAALTETGGEAKATPAVLMHHPAVAGGPELRERLTDVQRALATRKRMRFVYETCYSGEVLQREVDPYGLFCRRGRWCVVGFSHLRGAVRVFSLHRMRDLTVNEKKPRTPDFEVPADFRLRDHVDVAPWEFEMHDPVPVEIDVRSDFAWLAERDLGVTASAADRGWRRLAVDVTNTDAIVEWVLGMGDKARVVSPTEVQDRVRSALEAVLARYGAA